MSELNIANKVVHSDISLEKEKYWRQVLEHGEANINSNIDTNINFSSFLGGDSILCRKLIKPQQKTNQ